MVQDRARMPDQQKLVHGLPSDAILVTLNDPKPIFQGQAVIYC